MRRTLLSFDLWNPQATEPGKGIFQSLFRPLRDRRRHSPPRLRGLRPAHLHPPRRRRPRPHHPLRPRLRPDPRAPPPRRLRRPARPPPAHADIQDLRSNDLSSASAAARTPSPSSPTAAPSSRAPPTSPSPAPSTPASSAPEFFTRRTSPKLRQPSSSTSGAMSAIQHNLFSSTTPGSTSRNLLPATSPNCNQVDQFPSGRCDRLNQARVWASPNPEPTQ
jgi:hypothetical protein